MKLDKVDFSYGEQTILENFSMEFPEQKVTVVLGPSGCGKTTLLNLLSGALTADRGQIQAPAPGEFSYLFQDTVLFPWMSAEDHITFILPDSWRPEKKRDIARQYLEWTGLGSFAKAYPGALSGGMQQRLAMARSFAYPSGTLLMDEPFTGLDLKLKISLFEVFRRLREQDRRTSVLVTHDIQEALILGDEIRVLTEAPIRQRLFLKNPVPDKQRIPGTAALQPLEQAVYEALLS